MNRVDLTSERFVGRDARGPWYRTGDRVRRLASGDIEFLGRGDGQVKIRGYRVELGEIEQVLAGHPNVGHCAVVLREAVTPDAEPVLAAYVVLRSAMSQYAVAYTAGSLAQEMHDWLASQLPEYMVPTVVLLERLPLTPSGKLDRAALPDPQGARTAGARAMPQTPTEIAIAEIWCEVLKKDNVGAQENFVALGGHSLLAIRVLGKLSRRFGVRLPLRTLFDAPTVAALAELVDMEMKLAALEGLSDADAERLLAADTTDRTPRG